MVVMFTLELTKNGLNLDPPILEDHHYITSFKLDGKYKNTAHS